MSEMDKLKVLDLFSGILVGGFSLGLERTGGFETAAFCEIEPFPRKVLAKHWPDVPCYHDVKELTADVLAADGIGRIDVITGGFPCQDISGVGLRGGMGEGTRSGLFTEIVRLAREIRPRFVFLENVADLLVGPSEQRGGWFSLVLGQLASIGYDAEWHCIPASAVGAPHRRDRVWIVAYPTRQRSAEAREDCQRSTQWSGRSASVLADAKGSTPRCSKSEDGARKNGSERTFQLPSIRGCDSLFRERDWHTEPDICRVANGISANVDRGCALGNAVVPQIPELIGHAILASMREESEAA